MDQEKEQVIAWLKVFANFRNGVALTEIIKMEESFIKDPHWLSPLHGEEYRLYHSFEREEISRAEDFPFTGEGPLWDGICKDDASRKILFVMGQDTPEALKGNGGDIPEPEKAAIANVFKMLRLDGDLDAWYHEYYPAARALAFVTMLSSPFGHCMERGYRGELILMNIVDNYLGVKTSAAQWDAFYKEMIAKMFGERGLPYGIFTVDLQV
ncbi:hypothetical protein DSECCO2_658370 [anaerobic digester metagenome]